MDPCADNPPDAVYGLYAPATAIAPKLCRDFVGNVLELLGLRHLSDTAVLCTSELVSNAHQHAKGDVRLDVAVGRGHVRVAAHDSSPQLPSLRKPEDDETSGRGMLLVAAVSDRYGTTVGTAEGKSVWFQLDAKPHGDE
jgi:anti-sigma regulatory factor (Ser/Thr protein kinase)